MGRPACGNACLPGPGPWRSRGFASLSPDASSGLGTAKLFSQVLYKRVPCILNVFVLRTFSALVPNLDSVPGNTRPYYRVLWVSHAPVYNAHPRCSAQTSGIDTEAVECAFLFFPHKDRGFSFKFKLYFHHKETCVVTQVRRWTRGRN